jgi:hypothetical protein
MKIEDYTFEQIAEEFDLFEKLSEILNPKKEQEYEDEINF